MKILVVCTKHCISISVRIFIEILLLYISLWQNFDAVVGDLTVTENRSLYVDFTMQYTGADIVMVVPILHIRIGFSCSLGHGTFG